MQLYRDLEATPWGRVVLGNLWPAYLFALLLGARLWVLGRRLLAGELDPAGQNPHPVALLAQELTTVLFLSLIVLLFIIRRPLVGRHADARGGAVALAGTFLLNVVGFLPVSRDASTASLVSSTAVILAGSLFTIWSLVALGRCFGLLPEVRGLVTRGPYRWVRHPIYLGELVAGLGIVIAKPHPAVAALYVTFVVLQYWRTVLEERALIEVFPAEYERYRARTGRLTPRWR